MALIKLGITLVSSVTELGVQVARHASPRSVLALVTCVVGVEAIYHHIASAVRMRRRYVATVYIQRAVRWRNLRRRNTENFRKRWAGAEEDVEATATVPDVPVQVADRTRRAPPPHCRARRRSGSHRPRRAGKHDG
jgi:hypothetical protein